MDPDLALAMGGLAGSDKVLPPVRSSLIHRAFHTLFPTIPFNMSLSKYFLGCNNRQCEFGCGFYLPTGVPDAEYIGGPDTPANPVYLPVKCKICGCVGGQHLHDMVCIFCFRCYPLIGAF